MLGQIEKKSCNDTQLKLPTTFLGDIELMVKNQKVMLIAEVKKDNPSSCKAFEKIGFTKIIKNKYDFNVFKYQL